MALKGSPRTLFLSGVPASGFHGGRTIHIVFSVSFVRESLLIKCFHSRYVRHLPLLLEGRMRLYITFFAAF